MNNRRACPVLKSDVEVETMCYSCGHHEKESTACLHWLNKYRLQKGEMKQKEFDDKHKMLIGG